MFQVMPDDDGEKYFTVAISMAKVSTYIINTLFQARWGGGEDVKDVKRFLFYSPN